MSQNQQNPKNVEEAVGPLIRSSIPLSDQRMLLNEMFCQTLSNAPDDEIDNFTAKRMTPLFLALQQTLENLEKLTKANLV